ncbi:hypothetical protein [Hyalangium sp.]|uniref:toxin-antitoxin system YwqK family antitoxin n=1 Tax=Hyalangium sp. TaxID=2028555 RepID=UPI002D4398B7|nr:hypothetical protein [Hyalangium sp.]HYH94718.1 hypothetical protein [Hyalangium sp.]
MKLLSPALAALTVSLVATPPALALDQRQADALCAAWKLECPAGAAFTSTGSGKGTGALECKVKGRPVKEGPSVTCKEGEALSWGDWKAGKKHGLQVTMRPNGSWTEERFADGKLEGRSVEYSAEGQLLKDMHFQAGKKHGPALTYTTSGQLASQEFWDKGIKGKKPVPAAGASAKSPAEAKPKAPAKATQGSAAPAAAGGEEATDAAPAEEGEVAEEKPKAPASEEEEAPASEDDSQANTPQP